MTIAKRIVCLANSRKLGARCIAGRELIGDDVGPWIRPVTGIGHGEVTPYQCRCQDGAPPNVLDIVEVPLLRPSPDGYQQENWLIAPGQPWRKVGRVERDQLDSLLDPISPLWTDCPRRAYGLNDEIPLASAAKLDSSLRFVRVDQLTISVFNTVDWYGREKRRVRGRFDFSGSTHSFWVTDLDYEGSYQQRGDGDYIIGDCFLTISLGEPFAERGACYKLIAAIIEPDAGGAK